MVKLIQINNKKNNILKYRFEIKTYFFIYLIENITNNKADISIDETIKILNSENPSGLKAINKELFITAPNSMSFNAFFLLIVI